MRFILYVIGLLETYFCAVDIMDILNGNHTKFHIFVTVLSGFVAIACFAAAFNSLLNNLYGEDKDR